MTHIHKCPTCGNEMKYLGEWPEFRTSPTFMAHTFICKHCPKHGPPPGAYITIRIPTTRLAEIVS